MDEGRKGAEIKELVRAVIKYDIKLFGEVDKWLGENKAIA